MKIACRRLVVLIVCFALTQAGVFRHVASAAQTREVVVRGYITEVQSPTSFSVEDYRIAGNWSGNLVLENTSVELRFKPEHIRVGTEVEIHGTYDEAKSEVTVKLIKIDLSQFKKLKQTAFLTRAPENLERTEQGWRGTFYADGRRIRVEPATSVRFKLTKAEKKEIAKREKEARKQSGEKRPEGKQPEEDSDALRSLSDVRPGMMIEYEGQEQPDGSVLADRIEFKRNERDRAEKYFWGQAEVKDYAPNYLAGKPGSVKVGEAWYKTLPNKEVQEYVARIGHGLVPAYQRELPADDPNKIPFRFDVVIDEAFNAGAYPTGTVVVNTGLFDVLENEAQLAAILGHEIAHAIQEHAYRDYRDNFSKSLAFGLGAAVADGVGASEVAAAVKVVESAMANGYNRKLENQADRVGMEYMVTAGYDPREAPRVWKIVAQKYGDSTTTSFWQSHENSSTRRSYLMASIRNNYADRDFSRMSKNEEEFRRIVSLVRGALGKK